MLRLHAARCYLLAGLLVACVSSEPLAEGNGQGDATEGVGGKSSATGQGGRSGTGGVGASGGEGGASGSTGTSGNGGAGGADFDATGGRGGGTGGADFDASGGRDGGTGGADFDASDGRDGSSGMARDASLDEASTNDAASADQISETRGLDAGDAEGGTCGPMFCFDVFECWFLFPQCGYTACELFACKK